MEKFKRIGSFALVLVLAVSMLALFSGCTPRDKISGKDLPVACMRTYYLEGYNTIRIDPNDGYLGYPKIYAADVTVSGRAKDYTGPGDVQTWNLLNETVEVAYQKVDRNINNKIVKRYNDYEIRNYLGDGSYIGDDIFTVRKKSNGQWEMHIKSTRQIKPAKGAKTYDFVFEGTFTTH